jgi:hypothetical protein
MEHQDAEIADVVVILSDPLSLPIGEATEKLKAAGMSVTDVDADNGAIEGTLTADQIKAVQAMPFVKYVRKVFEYTADYPVGDGRNQDSDDESEDEDEFK